MSGRFPTKKDKPQNLNPVITISREYGCYASQIAAQLCEKLQNISKKQSQNQQWQWLTKEILEKAASDLQVEPDNISHIFGAEDKGVLEDIVKSFASKQYTSDTKIKKTITEVVKSYGELGFVIIVGRASCVILKDHPKALHIKLHAPFKWRSDCIKERFNITATESRKQVKEMEEKRSSFMNYFRCSLPENELIDISFNRKTINTNDIVDSIIRIMELKKLI
jgi:cytidylate kinase